jgi:hypothetical protein
MDAYFYSAGPRTLEKWATSHAYFINPNYSPQSHREQRNPIRIMGCDEILGCTTHAQCILPILYFSVLFVSLWLQFFIFPFVISFFRVSVIRFCLRLGAFRPQPLFAPPIPS